VEKERGRLLFGISPAKCDGYKPDSVRPGYPGVDGHFSQGSAANRGSPPVLRRVRRYPGSRFTVGETSKPAASSPVLSCTA